MSKTPKEPNCICFQCSKPIYRKPYSLKKGRVFCGSLCYTKSQTKLIKCLICENTFKSSYHKKTCSRACANKLRKGMKYNIPGRPKKDKVINLKMLKLRLIDLCGPICQKCGHDNLNILEIHHILPKAKKGLDNIENLILLCPNCHATTHRGDSRIKMEEKVGFEPTELIIHEPSSFQDSPVQPGSSIFP